MEHLAEQFKSLSDPTRLRVLHLLKHGRLCVCDLMAGLDLPQSTVSRHMSVLKTVGWVTSSRKGKWVYYRLAEPKTGLQREVLDTLAHHLPHRPEAREDDARLTAHLQTKTGGSCS